MNLKRYDRDYQGNLIQRAEGPLCLYSEVHDMSEALTLACDERDSLLAECETLRRKAACFDYISNRTVQTFRHGGVWHCFVTTHDKATHSACNTDLLTAIEATLAAKEQGNG